mgnify:CR=1 FL=1
MSDRDGIIIFQAEFHQPTLIFCDGIDASISNGDSEHNNQFRSQFQIEMEGVAASKDNQVCCENLCIMVISYHNLKVCSECGHL